MHITENHSAENSTEFKATVSGIETKGTGTRERTIIVSEEYGDKLSTLSISKIIDRSEIDCLEPGQIVFFRIPNNWLRSMDVISEFSVVALRTEEKELVSLSQYNEYRAPLLVAPTIVASIVAIILFYIALRCLKKLRGGAIFRRKKWPSGSQETIHETPVQKEAQSRVKRLLWTYRAASVILFAAAWIAYWLIELSYGFGLALAAFALSFWIALALRRALFNFQMRKIDAILEVNCDPELFAEVYRILITRWIFRKSQASMTLSIVNGLYLSGRFAEANKILQPMSVKGQGLIVVLYYHYLCALCSKAFDRWNEIESARTEVAVIAQNSKPESRTDKTAATILMIIHSVLAEHEKDYAAAFEWQKRLDAVAETPLQKVASAYSMAKLYYLTGETAQAKRCCEFVIEHGNKLYHVAKAKTLLALCNE